MTSSKIGLFSTIVAAFIIEFYKQLSPDSGNQTVALLGQISQQLVNFPNGTYSITANQPSPPSASMIWANVLWLTSLVLSLSSALIATMLQQWARNYYVDLETPKLSDPKHRARVRSFLFLGTEIYRMQFFPQLAFSLLHLSVYLFFAGLVIVFHTIDKNVAIALNVAVGVFGLAYIVLSTLPCLDAHCPYRTPFSYLLWYPTHAIPSFTAICLRFLVELLHGCLVPPGLYDPQEITHRQRILVRWLDFCEDVIKAYFRYIMDGYWKSIINRAIYAQGEDSRIVTRLFNLLAAQDNESQLRRFAASIPRHRVLDLIPRVEFGRIVLLHPLTILLRSCAAHVSGPDEEVRRRSLLVCLDAIRNIVENPIVPDLNSVQANLANISLMRAWLGSSDTAIRVTSRSICALLAKQVIREEWLEEPQRRWLQEVTGSRVIHSASPETKNHLNFKSFVHGVLSNQEGNLPTEDETSFKKTLVIILDVGNYADLDAVFQKQRLSEEVGWMHWDDPEGCGDVVNKLRAMFPFLPEHFPPPQAPPHV